MENFNLKQLGLAELSHQEMIEIDGGSLVGGLLGRGVAHVVNAVEKVANAVIEGFQGASESIANGHIPAGMRR